MPQTVQGEEKPPQNCLDQSQSGERREGAGRWLCSRDGEATTRPQQIQPRSDGGHGAGHAAAGGPAAETQGQVLQDSDDRIQEKQELNSWEEAGARHQPHQQSESQEPHSIAERREAAQTERETEEGRSAGRYLRRRGSRGGGRQRAGILRRDGSGGLISE